MFLSAVRFGCWRVNNILQRIGGSGRAYWPFALPALVLLPGLQAFIFPGSGAAFSDIAVTHYPNALFLQRALAQGEVPLWSPQILSGFPFVAHPFSGIWYPPYWLALMFPLPLGLNLVLGLHLVWAGIGMYRFLGQLGLPRMAAVLGGLAFEAAPKMFAHIGAGHLMLVLAVSWLPWLLWSSTDAARYRPRLAHSGVILALIFSADPRWAIYAGALWAAWALVQHRRVTWLAKQVLLAAFLALPAAWLYAEYGSLSTRAGLTPAELLELSLPPASILGLLVPQWGGFHEWVVYPGVAVLLLALIAQPWQRGWRFWLAVLAVALLISLGSAVPGAELVVRLPGLSQLRIPPRAMVLAAFAFSVLAARGLQLLLQAKPAMGRIRLQGAGVVAFLVFTLTAALWLQLPIWQPLLWAALVIAAAMLLIEIRFRRRTSAEWVAFALCGLALADLLVMDASLVRFRPAEIVLTEGAGLAERMARDSQVFRIYSPSYSIPQQTAAAYGFELAYGVDPLQLQTYAAYMQPASGVLSAGYSVAAPALVGDPNQANTVAVPDAELLGMLNVKYVASSFPIAANDLRLVSDEDSYLYINEAYRQRVWVQDGDELRRADILSRDHNRIIVAATGPGQLVFSEVAYSGWQAWLDRAPVTLGTQAGILRSVQLPAGEHEVELRFEPRGLTIGLPLALVTWVALLLWPRRQA